MAVSRLEVDYHTLVIPELHPNLAVVHSGCDVGNTDPRFGGAEQVQQARTTLQETNGAADQVYVMKAQGGTVFTDVSDKKRMTIEDDGFQESAVVGDGLITRDAGIGLMLNTADCVPLAVYQPDQKLLALIHLGWRGAAKNLHTTMLEYMVERHNFKPGGALAYIGPSISKESYTAESLSETQMTDTNWSGSIEQRGDVYHIDIPDFVVRGLTRFGIPGNNITSTSIDTGAETDHFSLTRHKHYNEPNGRNGFLVSIKP